MTGGWWPRLFPWLAREELPSMAAAASPLVGILMGSSADWPTLRHAAEVLSAVGVPHEARVVLARRTPDFMAQYAREAEARGLVVIIAGAGGAATLPGMTAAHTLLPVIGVPLAVLAIGEAGATNAGLVAAAIVAVGRPEVGAALERYRDALAAGA